MVFTEAIDGVLRRLPERGANAGEQADVDIQDAQAALCAENILSLLAIQMVNGEPMLTYDQYWIAMFLISEAITSRVTTTHHLLCLASEHKLMDVCTIILAIRGREN